MTNGGGTAANDYLVAFDGTNYSLLGGITPNLEVNKLIYNKKSGLLYAFGNFTAIGGITTRSAAFWDGNNWHPMPGAADNIQRATIDENGNVFAECPFWIINGVTFANTIAFWNGSNWELPEFNNDGTVYSVMYRKLTGEYIVSGYGSGVLTYTVPAVSTVTNSTEGNIYPAVTFDACGSYVYSLYNRTTGERIFLNGLRVYTGERIELVFSPTGIHNDIQRPGRYAFICYIRFKPNIPPAARR